MSYTKALREGSGNESSVGFVELFFDLVYVFAVTQLAHYLLGNITFMGAVQTLLLWFAVWLGWQYTNWVTNWFNPESIPIRLWLFVNMLLGLVMAVVIPTAFEAGALIFACAYVGIQVGRTIFVLFLLGKDNKLTPNFRRIFAWLLVSACFWIAGALVEEYRLLLWIIAVSCEYFSPMIGFRIPGLGVSKTTDWTINGEHLAERCQLLIIVALGESILVSGATIAHAEHVSTATYLAFLVAFVGSLTMWWIYFDTSSKDGSHVITTSDDPGRIGAYFHYVHIIIIAGLIVTAVSSDLLIAHPENKVKLKYALVIAGGPAIYLIGNAIYKKVVYGRFPLSHLIGLFCLIISALVASQFNILILGSSALASLLLVAFWETRFHRQKGKIIKGN